MGSAIIRTTKEVGRIGRTIGNGVSTLIQSAPKPLGIETEREVILDATIGSLGANLGRNRRNANGVIEHWRLLFPAVAGNDRALYLMDG
jgi:hypothetical protein